MDGVSAELARLLSLSVSTHVVRGLVSLGETSREAPKHLRSSLVQEENVLILRISCPSHASLE